MATTSERLAYCKKLLLQAQTNRQVKKFNLKNRKESRFNDFSQHIVISGEPRGGTTWLMEILKQDSDALIWEPLHPQRLEKYPHNLANRVGHIPYIPENAELELAQRYFQELFRGQLPYGLHVNSKYGHQLRRSTSLLFKFCRANMLLPWLTRQFPSIRPIYLIRHPLSVISSQFRHPAFQNLNVANNIFEIRRNEDPAFSEIFETHSDKINSIQSRESLFANWWAIQNLLPLKDENKRWLTISYESLFLRPTLELEKISDYLNKPMTRFAMHKINMPSSTTRDGSGILENKDQLQNFKRHLSAAQIKEILDIVNSYGIDCYSDAMEPDYKKLGY